MARMRDVSPQNENSPRAALIRVILALFLRVLLLTVDKAYALGFATWENSV